MKKDDLATKVDNFQHLIWTEYSNNLKRLKILKQEVSDLDLTNEILSALLREVQYLEKDVLEGEELEISVFHVFNSHGNDIRYGTYKEEVKRTLEKKCDWVVLDTVKKVFRIKLPT